MNSSSRLERWDSRVESTVGYGDFVPVTFMGRLIAVLLMVGGISLIGMVTAAVATWIVQNVAEQDSAHQAATAAQIDGLRSEITQLTNMIAAQHNDTAKASALPLDTDNRDRGDGERPTRG